MKEIKIKEEYRNIVVEYGIKVEDCRCFEYESGEVLLHQGWEKEYLYLVMEGMIHVDFYSEDGMKTSLRYGVSDGIVGEAELFSDVKGSSASVSALSKCCCIAYPYVKAKEEIKCNVIFLNRIAKDLVKKLHRITNTYTQLNVLSGEKRVLYYVKDNAIHNVYRETKTRIALETGLSYRHVSRIITSLCQKGVLIKKRDGYHIIEVVK